MEEIFKDSNAPDFDKIIELYSVKSCNSEMIDAFMNLFHKKFMDYIILKCNFNIINELKIKFFKKNINDINNEYEYVTQTIYEYDDCMLIAKYMKLVLFVIQYTNIEYDYKNIFYIINDSFKEINEENYITNDNMSNEFDICNQIQANYWFKRYNDHNITFKANNISSTHDKNSLSEYMYIVTFCKAIYRFKMLIILYLNHKNKLLKENMQSMEEKMRLMEEKLRENNIEI